MCRCICISIPIPILLPCSISTSISTSFCLSISISISFYFYFPVFLTLSLFLIHTPCRHRFGRSPQTIGRQMFGHHSNLPMGRESISTTRSDWNIVLDRFSAFHGFQSSDVRHFNFLDACASGKPHWSSISSRSAGQGRVAALRAEYSLLDLCGACPPHWQCWHIPLSPGLSRRGEASGMEGVRHMQARTDTTYTARTTAWFAAYKQPWTSGMIYVSLCKKIDFRFGGWCYQPGNRFVFVCVVASFSFFLLSLFARLLPSLPPLVRLLRSCGPVCKGAALPAYLFPCIRIQYSTFNSAYDMHRSLWGVQRSRHTTQQCESGWDEVRWSWEGEREAMRPV